MRGPGSEQESECREKLRIDERRAKELDRAIEGRPLAVRRRSEIPDRVGEEHPEDSEAAQHIDQRKPLLTGERPQRGRHRRRRVVPLGLR